MKNVLLNAFFILQIFTLFLIHPNQGITQFPTYMPYGMVQDADGNNYETIVIGNQTWTKRNLFTAHFSNGDSIANIIDGTEWYLTTNTLTPAWSSLGHDSYNDSIRGKLYNWYAVNDNRNICPTGWHVPNDSEWNSLIYYLDPTATLNVIGTQSTTAGAFLKDTLNYFWNWGNVGATNSSGFSARPAGIRGYYGNFYGGGDGIFFWTNSENGEYHAFNRGIDAYSTNVSRGTTQGIDNKSVGGSVRCIKKAPQIRGYLFNDLNGNCLKDNNEVALANISLMIGSSGQIVQSNSSGFWYVDSLTAGDYSLSLISGQNFALSCGDFSIQVNNNTAQNFLFPLISSINCTNDLTISPSVNSIQTGNTANFSATSSDGSSSIYWQSDLGQGFQTLNNYGNYSGTNTNNLSISNIQHANHNQQLRAISTSANCTDTSNIATIQIADTCITNVSVYDTITTNLTIYDTLTTNLTIYDTTNITTYDTITTNITLYDTLTTNVTVYDTLTTYVIVTDTNLVTVYDTLLTTVTDTLIINTTLSLPAPNNENTILIYPNPASDHITIDNGNYTAMAGYTIRIENNAGQQVFQSVINQAQFYVDLSTWTGNGLYFVHLIDAQNNTVTVRKIVLQ